jgi:hypothetical protein
LPSFLSLLPSLTHAHTAALAEALKFHASNYLCLLVHVISSFLKKKKDKRKPWILLKSWTKAGGVPRGTETKNEEKMSFWYHIIVEPAFRMYININMRTELIEDHAKRVEKNRSSKSVVMKWSIYMRVDPFWRHGRKGV